MALYLKNNDLGYSSSSNKLKGFIVWAVWLDKWNATYAFKDAKLLIKQATFLEKLLTEKTARITEDCPSEKIKIFKIAIDW